MVSSKKSSKSEADKLFVLADKEWSQGNLQLAFRLFLSAANAGNRGAQLNVGYFYDIGVGIQRNQEMALYWYKRAYRRGDASAAHNIATIWRRNHKPKRALAWFRRAVKLGDDESILDIAKHYLQNGIKTRKVIEYLTKVSRSDWVTEAGEEEATRLLKTAHKRYRSPANPKKTG
jgi:TPR repeat protein